MFLTFRCVQNKKKMAIFVDAAKPYFVLVIFLHIVNSWNFFVAPNIKEYLPS